MSAGTDRFGQLRPATIVDFYKTDAGSVVQPR
jgi:hypothetical protein